MISVIMANISVCYHNDGDVKLRYNNTIVKLKLPNHFSAKISITCPLTFVVVSFCVYDVATYSLLLGLCNGSAKQEVTIQLTFDVAVSAPLLP